MLKKKFKTVFIYLGKNIVIIKLVLYLHNYSITFTN